MTRLQSLLGLTISSVVLRTLFDRVFSSLIVFQMQFVDTWIFEPQQIGFFNAAFIVLLAPLFTLLWNGMTRAGREPSTPAKVAPGQFNNVYFRLGVSSIGAGLVMLLAAPLLMRLMHGRFCPCRL